MTTEIRKDMLEPGGWYRMEADQGARTAVLHIYGTIGHDRWWDDVSSPDLVRELDALDVDTIDMRINSPGGFVRDGVAILNALVRHKATITATVDGLAASAATIVLMAADEVTMGAGAELMIHDAWSIALGNSGVLRREADHLDKMSQSIAELYVQRAGGTAEEWRAAMLAETWYTAQEAVDAGFATRVLSLAETASDSNEASNVVPLDRAARALGWQHAGRGDAPEPFIPGAAARRAPSDADSASRRLAQVALARPSASPSANHLTEKEAPTMSDTTTFIDEVRSRLDVKNGASETDVLAALDTRLAQPAPKAELPDGVVTIERDALAALKSDAAAGREAREQQITDERKAAVKAAIDDGRIPPARQDHWLSLLEADPGAVESLNKLEPGLIPLESKGHTGGVDEAADEDTAMYAKAWPTEPTTDTKGA